MPKRFLGFLFIFFYFFEFAMPGRVLSADSLRGADTLQRDSQLVPCFVCACVGLTCPSVCRPFCPSIHVCVSECPLSRDQAGSRVQGPGLVDRASEYVKFMPRHPAILELVAARLIVAYACCLLLFRFLFLAACFLLLAVAGGGGNLFDFAHSWLEDW